MNIRSIFTEPAKLAHPGFRYGMLVGCLLLLAWSVRWRLSVPADYPYERNGNIVVVLMLLLNHLAYQFQWSTRVTIALRALALSWLVFTFF